MKKQLDLEIAKISEIDEHLDFRNKNIYASWLAQTYFFVRHSTRLLAMSAALCPFEYQVFHHRFLDHAKEEKSHEKLIENDLKNMGLSLPHFTEYSSTQAFYQTQYYSIQNIHPLSFLGYVMLLETLPIVRGIQMLEKIEKEFGARATTFVKVHTQEDIQHIENLMSVIQHLDSKAIESIKLNLAQAGSLYAALLIEVQKNFQTPTQKVA